MEAVITGDIQNSQKSKETTRWLDEIATYLREKFDKNAEMFRGDSFQILLSKDQLIRTALQIRALMLQFEYLDAKIGIGLGEIIKVGDKLGTYQGQAFIWAAESLENLKEGGIKLKGTPDDEHLNIMLELANLKIRSWSAATAKLVYQAIEYPNLNQKQLAEKLNITPSNLNATLKRAGYKEIEIMKQYITQKLKEQ